MSTHPSDLESRVSALEHRQYSLEIHAEELFTGIATGVKHLSDDMIVVKADIKHLSDDMIVVKADIKRLSDDMTAAKADIKHLSGDMIAAKADIKRMSNDMTASFNQMVQYDVRIEGQIDARFNKIEMDIADIRANMATKEDIATIDGRLDRLETVFSERLNRLETSFGEHTTLLTQILERLPR